MKIYEEITAAQQRIRPFVRETPLEHSPSLSEATGCEVYLKLENLQLTGSFKIRGATNKILSLSPDARDRGVVAASTGNHGAAVGYAARDQGIPATVFVPEGASPSKLERIRLQGAEVRVHGSDSGDTEFFARRFAAERGMTYVSPYNDPQIVGGQGTIGTEIGRQIDDVHAVFASLGGGGMISGIGCYLKRIAPSVEIIGCSPVNSCVMVESVKEGRILKLESKPTLSDGTAGGVEPEAITLELCRKYVDDYVVVTEDEIHDALVGFIDSHSMLIEGAAATAIAAFIKLKERFRNRRVVIVICGGNISLRTLRQVLSA